MKTSLNKDSLQSFIRSGGFVWPGCYPCALLMKDGEVIDARAAKENYRQIRQCMKDYLKGWSSEKYWTPEEIFIHWEGEPLICAHSGRFINSAYGEN